MDRARSHFAGFGLHTALGRGVAANLAALRQPIAAPQLATLQYAHRAEVLPYFLLADEPLADLEHRLYRVIAGAVEEAIADARLSKAELASCALFVGSSSADLPVSEAIVRRALAESSGTPLPVQGSPSNVALWIVQQFGLRGPDFTISTACASSANALLHADAMLRDGRIERALVVGFEHCNTVSALGFQSLQVLTADVMRPFDRRRNGLTLGEACAALVLDDQQRADRPFTLRGAASLCDTHSMTAPNPDGSSVRRVLEQALSAARLSPEDVAAVKVHGTASPPSDLAEAAGMAQVFRRMPALCALKPRIGHTLGASGLAEMALFCSAAEHGWLPGTPGICATASDLGIVFPQAPQALAAGYYMLNHFGFGGTNTSLIVSNADV